MFIYLEIATFNARNFINGLIVQTALEISLFVSVNLCRKIIACISNEYFYSFDRLCGFAIQKIAQNDAGFLFWLFLSRVCIR